ncbi:uncharacterized protein LOC116250980 isoform X2 [Nymphaea colorata]|uniref:uncharacterized protein LOC116250980 isoform X2 n=1 Tax=Nymphaea colorata TaxID=210225 RepID=UPI00129D5575|nr:uncharacterized protein LOC116250980 isoform X2 [Nymphaea colorata]
MSEQPRLYTHKPRKGQIKPKNEVGQSVSQPSTNPPRPAAPPPTKTSTTTTAAAVSAPKETFARRYKFVWPVLLMVNLAVGVSIFWRTRKMDYHDAEEVGRQVSVPVSDMSTTVPGKPAQPP